MLSIVLAATGDRLSPLGVLGLVVLVALAGASVWFRFWVMARLAEEGRLRGLSRPSTHWPNRPPVDPDQDERSDPSS